MPENGPLLATDLDGTLIPSPDSAHDSEQRLALMKLRDFATRGQLEIVFATGRHLQSVLDAIDEEGLPTPDWVICDVGSTVCSSEKGVYRVNDEYLRHLNDITGDCDAQSLHLLLGPIKSLRIQEPEKQQTCKLSYYCDTDDLEPSVEQIEEALCERGLPFGVVSSLDPIDGYGLIDVLPQGINKAYALRWWSNWRGLDPDQIVFAGDSGNDYAALASGFRGILVGNAPPKLVRRLQSHHEQSGTKDRIYYSKSPYTAGVLEGCIHFELVPPS
jgi:sucrose-6F-phosphate phosphohydrolase